jgi:hypothetical protein
MDPQEKRQREADAPDDLIQLGGPALDQNAIPAQHQKVSRGVAFVSDHDPLEPVITINWNP